MNFADFEEFVAEQLDECERIRRTKGVEYAGAGDRLANFKRAAALTGQDPLAIALVYAAKHWDSVCSFVRLGPDRATTTLSEPIHGRLQDLINYMLFIGALIEEERRRAP